MEVITAKVAPPSYESPNWHEPPPWVADPVKLSEKGEPALRVATELREATLDAVTYPLQG